MGAHVDLTLRTMLHAQTLPGKVPGVPAPAQAPRPRSLGTEASNAPNGSWPTVRSGPGFSNLSTMAPRGQIILSCRVLRAVQL